MSIEAQAELAEEFVRGVVKGFGLQAELTSEIGEDTVRIDVAGENVGLLIGPRGATVDALQEAHPYGSSAPKRRARGPDHRRRRRLPGPSSRRLAAVRAAGCGRSDRDR